MHKCMMETQVTLCVSLCTDVYFYESQVGSMLLAQDAAIFLVSQRRGEPRIGGQAVITTHIPFH